MKFRIVSKDEVKFTIDVFWILATMLIIWSVFEILTNVFKTL